VRDVCWENSAAKNIYTFSSYLTASALRLRDKAGPVNAAYREAQKGRARPLCGQMRNGAALPPAAATRAAARQTSPFRLQTRPEGAAAPSGTMQPLFGTPSVFPYERG
jgi:hypothetical protein